jgi:uncharacterized protein (DUF934 family)
MTTIRSHSQILHFPRGQKPTLISDEWQLWNAQDKDLLPQEHANAKVLLPFAWWRSHFHSNYQDSKVLAKAKAGQIGVWFTADEDILKHADLITQGKQYWPLVAAHFPLFRDGRSFSTAALLRERFGWEKEIRMIGDVLIDQLLQGARVGFDSFVLRHDQDLNIALKQFELFTVTTQNSWRGKRTLLATS